MKNKVIENYESPVVELIVVQVEKGFASTGGTGAELGPGGGIEEG